MRGKRLGHYDVISHLGSGGMGDVYRATDANLGRDVALKLLPDAVAADPDRTARLEREARLLASLNHPNIAAIHGLEEAAGRKFLVMELVEGPTLADMIGRDRQGGREWHEGLEPVLSIARQMAEALEAAHERGVIHRDLKPANVKVRDDGTVKLLDFGLAKAFAGDGSEINLSNSPTLSLAATNAGVILGTAAYMSPEQAKGQTVDRRTDIFAFGCVLFEMVTGRKAFGGETVAEILAAVLKSEPDWSLLPSSTPAALHRLLRRCLQKDRNRRLQNAGDARIEIAEMLEARPEPDVVSPAQSTPAPRRAALAWGAAAALTVVAVVLAVPALRHLLETPPVVPPEMRLDIVAPPAPESQLVASVVLSPDGRQIAQSVVVEGQPRLWVRALDASKGRTLEGTEGATNPFWSPDGRTLGFFADNKLKRIDVSGGGARLIADVVSPGLGASWSRDGVILFGGGLRTPLQQVSASGSGVKPVTRLSEGQVLHSFPQFLPDGRLFVFFVTGAEGERGIHLGSLDDPASRRLTPADTAAVLSPDGWLLYLRQGTLVAHRFDATTATLSGEPITITDRVRFGSGVWNIGAFSAAQGMIAYRAGERSRRQLTWFSRAGRSLGTFGPPDDGDLLNPELSPDGQRVAVQRTVQNNDDIFVFDGARRTRFTTDAERETYPVWSPTADRIAYSFTRSGNAQIFEKPSTGGNAQQLLQSSGANVITDWSLDGRYVLYFQPDPNTGTDLWVLTVGQKPALFLRTPFTEAWGRFSPDGRWVAYQSDESGTRNEIYVKPFRPDALVSESATGSSSASAGQQVSTEGGISPRWSRDGKELYYVAPGGMLMAAPITAKGATLVVGTPVALFHSRIVGGGSTGGVGIRQQYDVASDGRFLVNVSLEDSTASPITLLLNWKPDK